MDSDIYGNVIRYRITTTTLTEREMIEPPRFSAKMSKRIARLHPFGV